LLPAVIVPKSDVVTVHGDWDESVKDVRVRVVAFHMSVASEPAEVSVLAPYAQIVVGSEVIIEPIDVEAVRTEEFVFELTEVTALAT
jgi:hypothetical protein